MFIEPTLISISQNVSIIPVTENYREMRYDKNRCYQPAVDEKYEEGRIYQYTV